MQTPPLIIIQARMTSTRLPKKVMLPLCRTTALGVMVLRLEAYKENIVIATTNDGSEKPIIEWCLANGVKYYQGSCDDVLDRYYQTSQRYSDSKDQPIVRLTSDCPFVDSTLLADMLLYFHQHSCDYLSNTIKRTFPRGLDCEILTLHALERCFNEGLSPENREHVTHYIHHPIKKAFHRLSYENVENYSHYRLTLDEASDYEMIQALYRVLDCQMDVPYSEIIATLKNHPEIAALNQHVEQKKV